jgi:sortase (surface protein transpeptidase)
MMTARRRKNLIATGVATVVVAVVLAMTSTSNTGPSMKYRAMSSTKIQVQRQSLDSAVSASMRLSLVAPAVGVPLALVIPSIGVQSALLAVGMTKGAVMAAPEGGAGSRDWSDTFWYRGSAVPGAIGTATIAGHIDDRFGDYAVFGRLSELVRGDRIFVRNTKSGFSEQFVVTSSHAYTIAQAATVPVLDLIYGTGPPHGLPAQPSSDGLAHLSLVTCAGQWLPALDTHSERLVVSAVRVS